MILHCIDSPVSVFHLPMAHLSRPRTFHPLTSPQLEIWFDQLLHGDAPLYNIGGYMQLQGCLDVALFTRSATLLVQKFDALRIVLDGRRSGDEEALPMQAFADALPVAVDFHDFSSRENPREAAMAWMRKRFAEPFALQGEPLFRYAVLKLDAESFLCFVCYHHLIADGWTIALLARAQAAIYTALAAGEDPDLAAPSYRAFIENDRSYTESPAFAAQRQYWLRKFQAPPEPLFAPRYAGQAADRSPPGGCRTLSLPRDWYDRLTAFAHAHGATTFHAILGAVYVYFTRAVRREELVMGMPVLNRGNAAFKATAGLFVGVTAARFGFGADLSFAELMQAIGRELKQNYRHQRFPIGALNRSLGRGPDPTGAVRRQLFDIGVSYERHDYEAVFGQARGIAIPLVNAYQTAPLMLYVREFHDDEAVRIDFVYRKAYFREEDIAAIQQRLLHLLEAAQRTPHMPVKALPMLTAAQYRQLTAGWNATNVRYPQARPVHELIEKQAEATPDAVALVFGNRRLSYRALNEAANRLAHRLIGAGVRPDELVCICAERSIEMVVGLLAILKSGAAYVPLDPDYPAARLADMLDDAGGSLLLTRHALWSRLGLSQGGLRVMDLDLALTAGLPCSNPGIDVDSRQLAYTIYTSGSTGKPKGAGIPHGGLTNRLLWMQETYRLSAADRVLQKTPFGFDVSVWEFFWPLMSGAVLVVARPGEHKEPARLAELIQKEGITTVHFVPAMLQAFVDHEALPRCTSLRQVFASGEALPAQLQERFRRQSEAALYNLYGPTEAAIDVTAWACAGEPAHAAAATVPTVPIGRPIANTQIYLLDANMEPVPAGMEGELYIGGVQLARGYHRRPGLTAERFVPDPFGPPGARLYRTGDLGRWRADGAIEYLGRTDHQVKIRGLRIELGEIEARLSTHPAVRETVVAAREDAPGAKRLVAYLTTHCAVTAEQLRAHLQSGMPDYMIPSDFVFLDALPLSPNGKIDRRALPAPVRQEMRGYAAPRTPAETMLAQAWSDLLGCERIGADDNFFALGGHSLLAAGLVSRLRKLTGVELPLRAIFETPVLRDLARRLDDARCTLREAASLARASEAADDETWMRPEPADRGAALPLSFAQQRLWFLDQMETGSAFYNMAGGLRLSGELDAAALQAALNDIVLRHEALRTTYDVAGDSAVQVIAGNVRVPLPVTDLCAIPPQEREAQARRLAQREAERPFDLRAGPVMRVQLLRLDAREHWLLLTMHHIAADGWSMAILQREIAAFYKLRKNDMSAALAALPALPPLPFQYADFAAWQRKLPQSPRWERQLGYWRAQLAGAPALLALPTDRARPAVQSYRGARIRFELPEELVRRLHALGRENGATLFMTLLSVFGMLLSRYSGQDDICIGTPVANRPHVEFEGLIGCFVNTLVLRLKLQGNPAWAQLLRQVRETALDAYAHQDIPFERLVEALQAGRDLSHAPLFQVMFALENNATHAAAPEGLLAHPLDIDPPVSKFDLTLTMREEAGRLEGLFEYSTDLFERATMERMIGHFKALLADAAARPGAGIAALDMLTEEERRFLLEDLNRSRHDFPLDRGYAALFAEQAARHPDRIAAVCMGDSLTYRELDERSTRIARALVAAGAGPDVLVGTLGERGLCLLAMMIAIFKAGAAYVPLDIRHPVRRLADIASRGRLPIILASESALSLLHRLRDGLDHDPVALVADRLWLEGDATPLPPRGAPDDLAYVIFTSGSTGQPKGAMVEHKGMLNNLYGKVPAIGLGPRDRVAQTASPAFDISVWQFLAAPLLGGTVHIMPDPVAHDPARLLQALAEQEVSVLQVVPSMMRHLIEAPADGLSLSLRWVLSIGEALPPRLAQAWFARFPAIPLINIYGPAECADNVAFLAVRSLQEAQAFDALASVPVGRPTANTQLFVLDARLRPVPVGVPGEICVAGAGVGRGYLNDPETTAQAFAAHPFLPGERFYRTGDVGRWRADGAIDYLGRRDHQVKVGGQRIEPGDIESRLCRHPGVREAAVIGRKDQRDETTLVAYWAPHAHAGANEDALRRELGRSLPHIMIPSHFVMLDTLPVNANGKVDRKALAALPWQAEECRFEAPCTPVEERLALIWSDLLGLERIGRDDNVFHLGAHSLLATQAAARIRTAFGIDLPLRAIFEAPTLRRLALRVEQAQGETKNNEPALSPVGRDGPLPASFPQQRLWFLDQLESGCALYHLHGGLRLSGKLDAQALEGALNDIVARHEVLRTAFDTIDGRPVQRIVRDAKAPFAVHDLSSLEERQRRPQARRLAAAEASRPFDLGAAPLLRAQLLRLDPHEHWLLLTVHHIAADGWSIGILMRELAAFYHARCNGAQPDLPALPVQYADFAAWQHARQQGAPHERQLAYWRGQLDGMPALLDLPTDHPRPAVQSYRGGRFAFEIDETLTAGLHAAGRSAAATLFMTLSSAFALLLARYSGQDDVCIGTPVANRQRREFENLIGFFVNTLVLRFRVNGDLPFSRLLQQARETALAAYTHQDLPFEQLVEALRPERHLSHAPLFQVMFVLQDAPDMPPAWPGMLAQTLRVDAPSVARFDLTLSMVEEDGRLRALFEFNADLFERDSIARLSRHFHRLLQAIVAQPGTPVADLPLLCEQERRRMLVEWNQTHACPPPAQTIHELFEACVRKHPDRIAAVFEERQLSYAELNARADSLAHYLRGQGVGADELVGICIRRSLDMIIAVLGVLKAGGAYLPLDPALPPARMAYMLGDACPRLLLTEEDLLDGLPETRIPRLCLDRDAAMFSAWPDHPPPRQTLPDHLAYVIYTSGSTGKPKGTLIHHRGLVNLVLAQQEAFDLRPGRRVLQWASFNFDASVSEIFTALTAGAQLHLARGEAVLPGHNLLDTLRRHRIELVTLTPSSLSALPPEPLPELKTLVVAGEHCDHALIAPWMKRYTVINAYGPTEATVCATVYPCADDGQRHPPIGRPIANTQTYILDKRLHPVPIGVTGELYIGGEGLARGYLGRPDLTAERFIQNPFSDRPGARMYKTGDLARYLPDGHIEYVGRGDHQVKIRGYRIEPGEIEFALTRLESVREAVVLAQDAPAGGRQLVAYIVLELAGSAGCDTGALRAALGRSLPDYMIPAHFVVLENIPVNTNGKVDRQALEALGREESASLCAPLRTATEERLAAMWKELLGPKQLGRDDNFFHLGGHSLLAVRLAACINDAFRCKLPVSQIFLTPTIATLAAAIAATPAAGASAGQLVVPIRRGADGVPIWLVHPAGGTVFCYRALASRIGDAHSVYAIQSPEIAGLDAGRHDIDMLCRRYAWEITRLQTDGPVHLAGWSLGGALCLRIAEILERQGRRVAWVGLFDTMLMRGERPQTFEEFAAWAWTRVQTETWAANETLAAAHARAAQYIQRCGVEQLARELSGNPDYLTDGLGLDAAYVAFLRRQYAIQQAHIALLADFVPGRVHAPLHVFQAEESVRTGAAQTDWLAYTNSRRDSTQRILPGRHENLILLEENIDAIVRVLCPSTDNGRA